MEALQWAIGILVTIQVPVMTWIISQLWAHVLECRQVNARLAALENDMERAKEDIGTHDTGIRGAIHKLNTVTSAHQLTIDRWLREESRK